MSQESTLALLTTEWQSTAEVRARGARCDPPESPHTVGCSLRRLHSHHRIEREIRGAVAYWRLRP